jgi:hypothetical protein
MAVQVCCESYNRRSEPVFVNETFMVPRNRFQRIDSARLETDSLQIGAQANQQMRHPFSNPLGRKVWTPKVMSSCCEGSYRWYYTASRASTRIKFFQFQSAKETVHIVIK